MVTIELNITPTKFKPVKIDGFRIRIFLRTLKNDCFSLARIFTLDVIL